MECWTTHHCARQLALIIITLLCWNPEDPSFEFRAFRPSDVVLGHDLLDVIVDICAYHYALSAKLALPHVDAGYVFSTGLGWHTLLRVGHLVLLLWPD